MTAVQERILMHDGTAAKRRSTRRALLTRASSWAAVGVTAFLALAFVAQIGTFQSLKPPPPAASGAADARSDRVAVEGSTITGFDKHAQPYSVSAESAAQDAEDENLVHLRQVSAAMKRSSGEALRLEAGSARYDRDAETLDLDGTVRLVSSDRFVADMPRAQFTLRDRRFRSEAPVSVALDNGSIAANGLEITDEGDRIVFFNGVKATFRPASKGSTAP